MKRCFFIMALSMMWSLASAGSIVAISSDGAEDLYAISSVRSIKFAPEKSADKGYRTILFGEPTGVKGVSGDQPFIFVFPNPVSEYIEISGVDEDAEVLIFDMNGNVVYRTNGNKVDVSGMNNGNYILNVKENSVKFIKK